MAKKKKAAATETPEVENTEEPAAPAEETPVVETASDKDETGIVETPLDEEVIATLTNPEEDDDEIPAGEPEAEPKVEPEAAAEEPSKEEATPAAEEETAEEKAAKAAAEKQTPGEEPAPEEPAQPAQTPEEIAAANVAAVESRAEWRKNTEEALAVGHFAVSDELAQEMTDSPQTAFPKLAAKLYLDAVENAAAAVVQLLPQVLGQFQQKSSEEDVLKDKFFSTWDKLDADEHGEVLLKVGAAYRQANPNATPDEFIRDVGAATMVALKIPHDEPVAEKETPLVPAHKPLAPGTGPVAANATPDNQFTQLAEEIITDDALG